MKRLVKFGSIGFVIAWAIATSGQASAQNTLPPVFKVVNPITSVQSLVVTGAPRTQIPVAFTGGDVTRTVSVRGNPCGFAVLRNAAQYGTSVLSAVIGNTPVSFSPQVATAPGDAVGVPTCTGTDFSNAATSFPLPPLLQGQIFRATKVADGSVLLQGLTLNRVQDFTYEQPANISRFITTNACGYGTSAIPTGSAAVAVNNGAPVAGGIFNLPIFAVACQNGALFGAGGTIASTLPSAFRDSSNNVYFTGATTQSTAFSFPNIANTRSVTSDRCGGLLIGSIANPVFGVIRINNVNFDTGSVPAGARPRCLLTAGVYGFETPPTNVRPSAGQAYLVTVPTLQIQAPLRPNGFADRSIVTLETPGQRTVNATTNTCGVAVLRSTTFGNNPSTLIGLPSASANVTVASLPLRSPDRCVQGATQVRLN